MADGNSKIDSRVHNMDRPGAATELLNPKSAVAENSSRPNPVASVAARKS
ncbi:MAG: hypothetical protein ACRC62_16015 [Microcoleus sp.]